MAHRPAYNLRVTSRIWNLAVACLSGAMVCVPHLFRQTTHGFYYTVCHDVYELAGYSRPRSGRRYSRGVSCSSFGLSSSSLGRKLIMLTGSTTPLSSSLRGQRGCMKRPLVLIVNYTVHDITPILRWRRSPVRLLSCVQRRSCLVADRTGCVGNHQHVHGRLHISPTVTAPSSSILYISAGFISRTVDYSLNSLLIAI